MRDTGVEQVIKTASGVASLAREIDEIDRQRAAEYGLLSLLLGKAPDADTLSRIAALKGDASDLGMAHVELASAATAADDRAVSKEFFDLFIGLGRGELLPYASYYLTGFLHERPLARVREDLDALGIERAGVSREPEDHIAILLEVMAGLARGDFEAEFSEQARFFERHLKPWASRMFANLEMSNSAKFYRAVGRVGRPPVAVAGLLGGRGTLAGPWLPGSLRGSFRRRAAERHGADGRLSGLSRRGETGLLPTRTVPVKAELFIRAASGAVVGSHGSVWLHSVLLIGTGIAGSRGRAPLG